MKKYEMPTTEIVEVKIQNLLATVSLGQDDEDAGSRSSRPNWEDND